MSIGVILLWSTFAYGQIDSCLERLSQASQLYEKGKLSQVIQTLGTCLYDHDQNRATRRIILSMAAEAYIFMDSTHLAQQTLRELLKIDPFYKVNSEIPEMLYLREQVINYPRVEISAFFGPYAFSKPYFQSAETTPGAVITDRKYSFKGTDGDFDIDLGYHTGLDVGFALHRHSNFDLHIGINVSRYAFRYLMELDGVLNFANQPDKGSVLVSEKQLWLSAPVYLSLNLIPREEIVNRRFVPYVKLGGSYEKLHRGSSKITGLRLSFSDSTAVAIGQKNGAYRQSNTVFALAGVGFKLHLQRLFFLLDTQYSHSLGNLRNTRQDRLVIENYRYVDNDFRLGNLSIRAGFGVFLFNAKIK